MKRQTAMKEWRDVTHGAPDGVPTGRTVHAFAQRVEALALARHEKELRYLRDLCERASAQFATAIRGPADAELVRELGFHDVGHNA